MKTVLSVMLAIASMSALAWEGYDYQNGSHVEIEQGQLVRPGRDIEIFDYQNSRYKEVEVEAIHNHGNSVEIEVRDLRTGERRVIEMDRPRR